MSNFDPEALREKYKPVNVRVLFICESPPPNDTFFYTGNSNLYYATVEAFKNIYAQEIDDFLEFFRAKGFYLIDLISERGKKLKCLRDDEKSSVEKMLKTKLLKFKPRSIVITPKEIADFVLSVVKELTETQQLEIDLKRDVIELPFPTFWREEYILGLTKWLKNLIERGIIQ